MALSRRVGWCWDLVLAAGARREDAAAFAGLARHKPRAVLELLRLMEGSLVLTQSPNGTIELHQVGRLVLQGAARPVLPAACGSLRAVAPASRPAVAFASTATADVSLRR